LLLHVALYCLSSSRLNQTRVDYAASLLVKFVTAAAGLYGAEFRVYDVHSLVHICDDAKKYGCLENVSAFPFENHTKTLKKLVRQSHNPLQQCIKLTYSENMIYVLRILTFKGLV